ncbi:MAG TPA: SpoIIE family protein phosphatase [Capillimicrobium sp.]|nr:SpoIIE family protein phosphatase [Capillimicrobium sp.]
MTPGSNTRNLVLACAALFVALVVVLDATVTEDAVLISMLIIGPLAVSTVWGPRATALFSAPVVALAALQVVWNDNAGEWSYPVPLAVVFAGSWAAIVSAWLREAASHYAGEVEHLSGRLSASEAQLEAVLEHAGEAIIARRPGGELVFANQAAAEILGLRSPAELEAQTPQDLMDRYEVTDEAGEPLSLDDLPGTRILRGEARELPEVVVRNVDRRTGVERWLRNKATPVVGPDGRVEMAVNLVQDVTDAKRAELVQRLLARAGAELSSSLDYERTLRAVAELAVPGLADWCAVDLPDEAGRIVPVAIVHRDPAAVERARRLREEYPTTRSAPGGVGMVIRTGESWLVEEVTPEMVRAAARDERHLALIESLGLRSLMVVPMRASTGAIVGAITFASTGARRYREPDLPLAEELARRAGVAVENARLYQERSEIAHTLQSALLPPIVPEELPGWELATSYRPAGALNEVGGDFFDAVRYAGGWALIIGDVAGKGAPAASVTALARHTLHSVLELTGSAQQALWYLNERLTRRPNLSLSTAAVVMLHDDSDLVEVVAAGHPLPLLRRDGTVEAVGAPRQLLGAFAAVPETWAPSRHEVRPGDHLLLYTDGVLDAPGDADRFGEQRLRELLSGLDASAREAVGVVEAALDEFQTGPHPDDVALVALRRV